MWKYALIIQQEMPESKAAAPNYRNRTGSLVKRHSQLPNDESLGIDHCLDQTNEGMNE
jgi:hypothetical protein